MDLFRIFFLTFTLLSGCIRESKTIEHNKIKYQKKNEAIADQSLTCSCFPKNLRGKRISELIAPIDMNKKRLVVYIYKTNNNDFTTYVPNKEKQRVFPDLTFDEGDNLRYLNTEKVVDLYNINSELTINSIAKEVKKKESIDGTLQSDVHLPSRYPNDLWATIAHDYSETKQYDDDMTVDQAAILQFLNKYPITSDLFFPGDLLVFPAVPSQISISETGNNYPSSSDFPVQGDLDLYSSAPTQVSESDTSVNYPSLSDFLSHGDLNTFPLSLGQISASEINTNQQIISDSSLHKDLNVFPPTVEQIAVPEININQPSTSDSLLQKDLNISPTAAGKIKVPEIKVNQPSINDLLSNQDPPVIPSKSEHVSLPQTSEKYPDISKLPLHDDLTVITIPPDYNAIKKIEQWFEENKSFKGNINIPFLQMINKGEFIIILLKALHENGIKLSKAGDLIDWNGNTLDMSKLKLMPVILGDSVNLNNLLNQNKCFMPFDLSFLQGILVTLTYPPRILGVIPLGKILEETAHYTNHPCYSDSNKQAPRCGGGSCQIKTVTDQNVDISKESSNDRLGIQANLNINLKSSDVHDSTLTHDDIKGIIKNTKPVKDFSEDNILGLRIIGGQAATSSGTPVTSKGRSADV